MPEDLVKLTNLATVLDATSNHRLPSWLAADLTQQEIGKLMPIAQQIAANSSAHTQFVVRTVPIDTERLEGLFSSEGLGYLPPDKVKRYFVGGLSQEFGGGLLHQVVIDFEDSWQNGRIGTYTYWRPYERSKVPQGISSGQMGLSHSDSGYNILSGPVLIGDGPATEYIVEDRAGKFIPISQSWIESLILKGRQSAETIGNLNPDFFVWPDYEKAKRLAKATGRQDLVDLVNAAIVHANELVAQGPAKHKEELRQRSIYTGTPRYMIELSGDLPQSWQSGMEEYDSLSYAVIHDRGNGGVDPELFPYSLESLSTQFVAELMKHFAGNGFDLDYIREHMKTVKIG